MNEKPILFSAPMVRAIRDNRKTQTRRVVKPSAYQRKYTVARFGGATVAEYNHMAAIAASVFLRQGDYSLCPYGQPGDRLWVRETFSDEGCACYESCRCPAFAYRADVPADQLADKEEQPKWKPSIFMPRRASRITLEVTGVRVERLQDISEQDAKAEGIGECQHGKVDDQGYNYRGAFQNLWDSINGKDHPWASNPWVWVVSFTRISSMA